MQRPLTCVEICAGAGGQALGLAMAGFVHVALVEYEADYCEVLRKTGQNGMLSVRMFTILMEGHTKVLIYWRAACLVPFFCCWQTAWTG